MRKLLLPCLLVLLIGCSSGDKAKETKNLNPDPKTSMGQAVKEAKDLAKQAQDRADELDAELEEE